MAIRVRADVIDIRSDTPRIEDVLFVDTNIWYWTIYGSLDNEAEAPQTLEYGYFLGQAIAYDVPLYYCPLSLAELSHSIEIAQWKSTARDTNQPNLSFKHFRRTYHAARRKTYMRIDDTWQTVLTLCGDNCLSIVADEAMYPAFLATFGAVALDGYDVLMLNAMREAGITRIITDDADFGQVEGVQVLTANAYLLEQAEQQGRLLKR